ncbi:hypothetical protein IKG33_01705 [Candidatus Saccharibacteria bacterium]|nr:hypothetical protein [Candidatus Saccharibacteria bacterium]
MEQNATAAMPVMDGGNQKSGNGLKIATVIASFVAVCGIGFGIYGMVQSSQKDSQISDLETQIKDLGESMVDSPEPTITTDVYDTFANNLSKENPIPILGNYCHMTDSGCERYGFAVRIDNAHLTITGADSVNYGVTYAEMDNVINASFASVGNGVIPYVYIIKKDGNVARINMSEDSARTIEDLDGYERIVSIISGADSAVYLIDIDGNVYKNS